MAAVTYRSSIVFSLFLLVLSLGGCMQKSNTFGPADGNADGATITVNVSNIDPKATILVVELRWWPGAGPDMIRIKRTLILDPDLPFDTLSPDISGLDGGRGDVWAVAFRGTERWQSPLARRAIEVAEGGQASVLLELEDHGQTPDGDAEADGDTDTEISPDGDRDQPDGDESEGEADAEETPIDPALIVSAAYSSIATDRNGKLNQRDSGESWNEWGSASRVDIPIDMVEPVRVYLMQDTSKLMIGWHLPTYGSEDETQDHIQMAFDILPFEDGGEFILDVQHLEHIQACLPIAADMNSCADLPTPLSWNAAQAERGAGVWEAEVDISFQTLGLTPGEPRMIGFALLNLDNATRYTWPAGADGNDPGTWGYLDSPDDWGEAIVPDGDDEPDADPDPDPETIDGDSDPDPDPDPETIDGDADPDPDPETETTDGDATDTDAISCTPAAVVCEQYGSVWHALTCNGTGDGWAQDETCNDSEVCTKNLCLNGSGCYYPADDGKLCPDDNYCTTDVCSGGQCQHEYITCEERACQTFSMNIHNPVCCEYTNKDDGLPCEDEYVCSNSECLSGACTPNWVEGCCEAHPDDMRRIAVGGFDYCVDKYEAIIASETFLNDGCNVDAEGLRYGEINDNYPAGFGDTVTFESQTEPLYACNNPAVNPSHSMTYFQAQVACENVGKRLCSAQELFISCSGGGLNPDNYPYGDAYQAGTCNGESDHFEVGGFYAQCQRDGVFDLSGNLEEWAEEIGSDAQACGGNYSSSAADLTCDSCVQPEHTASEPYRGFRCCAETGIPE